MKLLQKKTASVTEEPNGKPHSDQHSSTLFDLVPHPVAYIDHNGCYTYVNKAYAEWHNIELGSVIGKTATSFWGKEIYDVVKDYIARVLGGELVTYNAEIPFKDGKRYVHVTYTPDVDKDGNVKGFLAVAEDITEKNKKEKELIRKQTELQDYVDNAPIGLHWVDGNGIILWANKEELNMLGYGEEEYVGHHISEFHASKQKIEDILKKLSCNERINQYEAELKCKDGSVKTVLINSNVLWEDGNFIHTRCFTVDITDKKQAEKKLQDSQSYYEQLMHGLPVAVYTCDTNGYVQFYNTAAAILWGQEPEIGASQWCGSYKAYKPDGEPVSMETAPMAQTFKTGKSVFGQELIIERPDGSKRTIVPYPRLIQNAEGELIGGVNVVVDITSLKDTETALRDSEQRYRTLVHGLPAAVYTCDKNGYITMYNEAATELWGRQPEIGKDLWCGSFKIFEPDGITPLPLETCPMAIALKEGRAVKGKEIIVERPGGERRNVLPHPEPIVDINGNVTGAVNMLIDITDRKIAERHLAKLAAIVYSSNDAIYSENLEGIVTSWNPAAGKLFGYTADEMIGQPITKIIPFEYFSEALEMTEALRKGVEINTYDTIRRTKDGRLIDISLTASSITDKSGNIIGVSKIARDITEEKKLLEAVTENEERLRIAMESTKMGTWEYNPGTYKLFCSKESRNICGLPEDLDPDFELIAKHIHPDDAEYFIDNIRTSIKSDDGGFNIVLRFFRYNDKKLRWVRAKGKIFFDQNHYAQRLIGTMIDITDEKLVEQLVNENEERLRMAVEATNLGTWEYQPLTGNLSWSQECRNIYEVPDDIEPSFEFFTEHIFPDDKEFALESIQKAMDASGSGNYDIQYRILTYTDRSVRWIRTQGKAFFNGSRQAERFIGTVLDITEEKMREQELKEGMELFQTMADNVPAMIWMSGNDKFTDYFNKTWLKFRGRGLEDEGDEGWLDGVHPDDVDRCIETYNRSFKLQEGFYTEYRLLRHDGQYRWIADNCVPRFSADGEFVGFISACMDIDDQKRFREKIEESELLFKTISNASPAALWMTDADEQNVFVSNTWLNWTGKEFEDVIHRGWLESVIEEDKPALIKKFQHCFAERNYFNAEFRFQRKDGDLRWALTEGSPFYDINQNFAGFAGSVTDITDIKKLEQRKDDFIKMASHELKTPITSINGYVQLLMNIYNDLDDERLHQSKATVRSSLATISKQVSKLTRLITELLDLSRIETGKLELKKIKFNLGSMINEVIQDVRHTVNHHAIILHSEFEGDIYADKDRIGQVVTNLLTNAIKYSPEADRVEVFVENDKTMVSIKIKDHGIGVDKKDHSRIFERFYRVEGKSEQTYPGFGIGLFIASEIITRHNGTIEVKSEKGKGAEFIVRLPL